MWKFNEKIETSGSQPVVQIGTYEYSPNTTGAGVHGDNCDCCEVCVENNNLFLDEQERILRDQPSSQPAGYDPSEFLSPPVIQNPSLNDPAEIQTANVNTLVQTPVIAPVLAYDTPCKESDVVYDSETTITDSAYGRGYEAESENDNSSYSHNQEFVEVGNIVDVVQLPEPEPPLIQSPPLQYPEEWDNHIPTCNCDICGASVTSARNNNFPVEERTPEKKIKITKPDCVKYCHSIRKFGKPKDDDEDGDNSKPKSFSWSSR